MSEQQADEAAAEPTDTASDSPDTSESGDTSGSSESGDSSRDVESTEPGEVSDEQLPEDLQATEDNPLARHPRQTGDEDDKIGADSETGNAADPSASMTYGEDSDDEGESDSDEDSKSD